MVRTVTQIMAEIQADTIAENPSLCDWSLNSFNRKKTIPIAKVVQELELAIDSAAAAHLVPSATGTQLNELVADRGLTRLGGTKALGQVTFIRNLAAGADILIPLGAQVSTQDTDGEGAVYFVTVSEVTIQAGQTSIDAYVEAEKAGSRGNVRAASVVNLPGGLPGVDYVTNVLTFTGGSDTESDEDLRQRYIMTGTNYGRATVPTMKEWLEGLELDGLKIVREAKVYNEGQGDVVVVVDTSPTDPNITLVQDGLEACLAGGVSSRGMLAARIKTGANAGNLGDAAGGQLWVRARQTITSQDTFSLSYLYQGGESSPHTATFTVPAGTVEGKSVKGTLQVLTDLVLSVNTPSYSGSFDYDALIGYGVPPLLFITPELVTIDVNMAYVATDTPESNLADLIEASITAFLSDFAIGEELQYSDLYDAARIQYLGSGKWGSKFEGIDEVISLSATDGTTIISELGDRIQTEEDGRIDPGTVTVVPWASSFMVVEAGKVRLIDHAADLSDGYAVQGKLIIVG
jgi:hypothetical protein